MDPHFLRFCSSVPHPVLMQITDPMKCWEPLKPSPVTAHTANFRDELQWDIISRGNVSWVVPFHCVNNKVMICFPGRAWTPVRMKSGPRRSWEPSWMRSLAVGQCRWQYFASCLFPYPLLHPVICIIIISVSALPWLTSSCNFLPDLSILSLSLLSLMLRLSSLVSHLFCAFRLLVLL